MGDSNAETQTVTAAEARRRWGDLFDRVARHEARVVVEEGGVPVAAFVSAEDLRRLMALDQQRAEAVAAFTAFGEFFRDVPDEEVAQEVAKAVAEVRAENRQRKRERVATGTG